jgi:hypothetical protein
MIALASVLGSVCMHNAGYVGISPGAWNAFGSEMEGRITGLKRTHIPEHEKLRIIFMVVGLFHILHPGDNNLPSK